MRLMPLSLSLAVTALSLVASAGLAQPIEAPGAIEEVTVYRGQALVGRKIDVPGGAGLHEIVVTGLPEALQPASLFAEGGEGVEVRSVRYRVRPASEDARAEVARLESSIREANDLLEAARARARLLEWHRVYLDRIENFITATGTVEMGKGVLNADTIAKLFEFALKERAAKMEEGLKLTVEIRRLEEQVNLLQRELGQVSGRTSRTAREAVIFVNSARAGGNVRLNYIVDRASWSPSYILRSGETDGKVVVEYQASIQQLSGEDWGNVKLTLSTATPALVAGGPTLQPLRVALAAPGKSKAADALKDRGYADAKRDLAERQQQLEAGRNMPQAGGPRVSGGGGAMPQGDFDQRAADDSLNDLAGQGQLLDLVTTEQFARKPGEKALGEPQPEDAISVSYDIPGRTSMPSRADQQLVQIARLSLPATTARVATPVLTSNIYLEASITNSGEIVLLSGPASSYIGPRFVGRGRVPTVAAGETFTAGFGIDSSLRAERALVERTETIQGGNRVVEFTYRLSVENFSRSAAAVRVLDRVPQPKGSEMRVTIVSSSPEISTDAKYLATDRKNGILRWDINVPGAGGAGGAAGAAGTPGTIEYKFRLEYDKQMTVSEGA